MAGFLGWLRLDDGQARVAEALESLRHHPSFVGDRLAGDERCGAAVLYRADDPPEVVNLPERGLVVAIVGAVLEYQAGRWHRFTARELSERYLDQGIGAVSGLDGFYQLLIWDGEGSRLHILDDRVGSMWVQHARTEAGVAFAPEAKALFRLLTLTPRLDFTGVMSFLNMGYPIGTHTLFEGVRLLAPAHRFSIDLCNGLVEQERTWVQRFEPDSRLPLRASADLLYEAILQCHRAPLGRRGERASIAMTGGYDSRVMLHALLATGQRPERAVTWGATDSEPNSDPPVACALAESVGVPHRFLRYGSESVAEHARQWIVISELASDNPGYFAAGPKLLYEHNDPPPDAVYIGDTVITSGGLPRSVDEALTTILWSPVGGLKRPLANLLVAEAGLEAAATVWREVHRVVEACPSLHPSDIQDYFWSQVYRFRWLFSPGFYKEPMLPARRPMLLGVAHEALAHIPAPLRVYRRMYVEMVKRLLTGPFENTPRAEANSLVDWNYDSRHEPGFRAFLLHRTDWSAIDATPVAAWLDREAAEGMRTAYFQQQPRPMGRQSGYGALHAVRRRFAASPLIGNLLSSGQRLARRGSGWQRAGGADMTPYILRLAMIVELCFAIAEGAFTDEPQEGSLR